MNENSLSEELGYSKYVYASKHPQHIGEHVMGLEPEQMSIDEIAQKDQKSFRCYNIEGYKNKYIGDAENTHCHACTFLATEKKSKKTICALRYHNILLVQQSKTDPYLIFPGKYYPRVNVRHIFGNKFDKFIPVDQEHRKEFFRY